MPRLQLFASLFLSNAPARRRDSSTAVFCVGPRYERRKSRSTFASDSSSSRRPSPFSVSGASHVSQLSFQRCGASLRLASGCPWNGLPLQDVRPFSLSPPFFLFLRSSFSAFPLPRPPLALSSPSLLYPSPLSLHLPSPSPLSLPSPPFLSPLLLASSNAPPLRPPPGRRRPLSPHQVLSHIQIQIKVRRPPSRRRPPPHPSPSGPHPPRVLLLPSSQVRLR